MATIVDHLAVTWKDCHCFNIKFTFRYHKLSFLEWLRKPSLWEIVNLFIFRTGCPPVLSVVPCEVTLFRNIQSQVVLLCWSFAVVWLCLSSTMGSVSWFCPLRARRVFRRFSFIPLKLSAVGVVVVVVCRQLCLLMRAVKGRNHVLVNSKSLSLVTSDLKSWRVFSLPASHRVTLKGPNQDVIKRSCKSE